MIKFKFKEVINKKKNKMTNYFSLTISTIRITFYNETETKDIKQYCFLVVSKLKVRK